MENFVKILTFFQEGWCSGSCLAVPYYFEEFMEQVKI